MTEKTIDENIKEAAKEETSAAFAQTARIARLLYDGTLVIYVDDYSKVRGVLVREWGGQNGALFHKDADRPQGEWVATDDTDERYGLTYKCNICGSEATQTETQNSNLTFKTLEYCDICDHKGCEECIANALDEHCMPSQFKKQIEDECAKEYEELGLKELKELIEADRKTEPSSSEIPNNCETCKHYKLTCDLFSEICKYEPKDEPTISKMEQVDKDINVRSKDERQTKGVWNAGYKTGYDKGYKDAQKVKDSQYLVKDLVKAFCEDGTWLERQGVYTLTLAEAKQRAVDIIESVLAKEEPQAYVINPQEPTNDEKCFECDDFFTCGGQCNKIKDEPQAGEMMTEEEFDSMLARALTGKNEPQTDYERGYQDGIKDEIDKHHIGR